MHKLWSCNSQKSPHLPQKVLPELSCHDDSNFLLFLNTGLIITPGHL